MMHFSTFFRISLPHAELAFARNIADVLPSEARKIEELRRLMLDNFRLYGYELVMPPLLEYLESLMTGAGKDTDLRTFKLVDQAVGPQCLGLRAGR